jgi:UDP-glucuronate decarboxylase
VLVSQKANVICLDDLSSGLLENIDHLKDNSNFRFVSHDISKPIFFGINHTNAHSVPDVKKIDVVMHMASRASPFEFTNFPLSILKSNTLGTFNALGIANAHNAIFYYSSTSEVYGDPTSDAIPTPEEYFGRVNPIGPRSCYDESKRAGEAFIMAYIHERKIDAKITRIFNTYGPRIRWGNLFGRVIPNFIYQALHNQDITIFGDGTQTRCFTYVVDEVEGILLSIAIPGASGIPINLGTDDEITILKLAETIIKLTGSNSKISFKPLPIDDPVRRKPLLNRAMRILNWRPLISLDEGLAKTILWFKIMNTNKEP